MELTEIFCKSISMRTNQSQKIIVLGMHRSGTSLTMNLLSAMGCFVGEDRYLLPPTDANPQGFWEHQKVVDLNKNILNVLDLDWISAHQFEVRKLPQNTKKAFSSQIKEIISNFNSHKFWAIKDPRFCLTLPLWRKHLSNFVVVVCTRHPIEIAKSLHKRNGLPLSVGCALWESYTRAIIKNCRGLDCLVVSYGALIDAPLAETQRIYKWVQKNVTTGLRKFSSQKLKKIVNPKLYRQNFRDNDCPGLLTKEQQSLFASFTQENFQKIKVPSSNSILSNDILNIFNSNRSLSTKLKKPPQHSNPKIEKKDDSSLEQGLALSQLEDMGKKYENICKEQRGLREEQESLNLNLKKYLQEFGLLQQSLADQNQYSSTGFVLLSESIEKNQSLYMKQFHQLQDNLSQVSKRLAAVKESQRATAIQLGELETRAFNSSQFDSSLSEIVGKIEHLEKRIKKHEARLAQRFQENDNQIQKLSQLELSNQEKSLIIEQKIKKIRSQKKRITDLEQQIAKLNFEGESKNSTLKVQQKAPVENQEIGREKRKALDKNRTIEESGSNNKLPTNPKTNLPEQDAYLGKKWTQTFLEVGGLQKSHKILDVGCGSGRMASAIGEHFSFKNSYVGFDIIKKYTDFCHSQISKTHSNYKFFHFDIFNKRYNPKGTITSQEFDFPVAPGSIDFCIATAVFTHLLPLDLKSYIHQASKSLTKGGTLFATFFLTGVGVSENLLKNKPRFNFSHQYEPFCSVYLPDDPEKAVSYDKQFIETLLINEGLGEIDCLLGGWRGISGPRHSQDIVVAKKH